MEQCKRLIIDAEIGTTEEQFQELVQEVEKICPVANVLKEVMVIFVDVDSKQEEDIKVAINALSRIGGVSNDDGPVSLIQ